MSASRTIPSRSPTITPHIETVCAKNTRICPTNSDKRASSPLYPGSMASNSISVSVNLNAAPDTAESNYLPLQNLCLRGKFKAHISLKIALQTQLAPGDLLIRPGPDEKVRLVRQQQSLEKVEQEDNCKCVGKRRQGAAIDQLFLFEFPINNCARFTGRNALLLAFTRSERDSSEHNQAETDPCAYAECHRHSHQSKNCRGTNLETRQVNLTDNFKHKNADNH